MDQESRRQLHQLALPVGAGTPAPSSGIRITTANADRVTRLARWGQGPISEIAWSPDGKTIAVASSYGMYFYNAETLAQVRFIEHTAWVWSVAFSPEESLVASGSLDGTIGVWGIAK